MNPILASFLGVALAACSVAGNLPIIPKPFEAKHTGRSFLISKKTSIYYSAQLKVEAQLLASALEKNTGNKPELIVGKTASDAVKNGIFLRLAQSGKIKESYKLSVTDTQIRIIGNDAAGVFYGIQSLLQLIAKDGSVPGCHIVDHPRFAWRGMHLDVGRHMFDTKDIKKFIDWLAFHKLNTFHWHLTEDQGWRIEIKKYPKLTSVGGFRASSPPYGDRSGSDGTRYGGFYTQNEIKEIVAYAKKRHVTIVPEIDMPGHMAAAIAAYPWLGNDDIANYNPTVATQWGIFPYILSPKEKTFQWLDDVLAELCELFPSSYIHIGGDEAPKGQWQQSKFAQSVMKREGCKNEHDLQSYFIGRVEKLLRKRGRKLIGWDEIREGGLSPNATVMLWRGWDQAIASVNEGHDVVMAPMSHTYFDHYQYDPAAILSQGPEYEAIGGHRTIESVYSFNPVPEQFLGTSKEKHILGCQAQLWTEYMKTWDKVEYRAFPRIAAIAEVAWTSPGLKNYEGFMKRLKPMLAYYKASGVNAFDVFDPPSIKTGSGHIIETTLPAYGGHQPLFAVDGKQNTCFWSSRSPEKGDNFTVLFPKGAKTALKVKIQTGSISSGKDSLKHGTLEGLSEKGSWQKLVIFNNGTASSVIPKGVKGVRIRVEKDQEDWLIIREIEISE